MTDYNVRNTQRSRKTGQDKRRRSNKVSAFEKYEEIRFQCYELQQKMSEMSQIVGNLSQSIADPHSYRVNFQNQTMEVPLSAIEQLHTLTFEISNSFGQVQNQWSDNFDEQQNSNTRQRSKNRLIKKKLKDMENQSLGHIKDQKEFEKTLHHITKAQEEHTSQMGQHLDQIESQVSELKNTRNDLNCRYEGQLDQAVKEMIHFYDNLECADPKDIDSDNMSIEQVFFIKPAQNTSQTLQRRGKSQLRLSNRVFSSESNQVQRTSYSQQRTPNIVPRLPIDKLQGPEAPKIININSVKREQRDQRNSAAALVPSSGNKNSCPSGRQQQPSQRGNATRGSSARKSSQKADYVVNPVMIGAMQMGTSKFDNKFEKSDFEGANVTMDMQTVRLKQFPEDYQAINSLENSDERILLKQVIFLKYEKILKKQAKLERKKKKKALKEQKAAVGISQLSAQKQTPGDLQFQQPKSMIPTPTHKSSYGFGKFQNNQSSKGSLRGAQQQLSASSSIVVGHKPQGLGINERNEYNDNSQLTSRFSLHSELPSIDTQDVVLAQKKFQEQDVNRTELMDCEEDLVHGMKTATQTSLIKHYEEEFKKKEIIRDQIKQEEKKIDYNSSGTSDEEKYISQGSNPIASNNSGSNAILIADSADVSILSTKKESVKSKKSGATIIDFSIINSSVEKKQELLLNELQVDSGFQESPSVLIKNSYVNSDQSPIEKDSQLELDINDFENQNKIFLDQIGNEFKQRLPLDVIQERQSEFSQSMITNAQKIADTNRSRQSKQANQYHNIPKNGTGRKTVRSDCNQSSANRKNSSREMIIQDSFTNETSKFNRRTHDFEEQKSNMLIRSNSVAHTHRNDSSFMKNEHHICIDGSLIQSRNQVQKNANSQRDRGHLKMYKQPSAGNFETNEQQYFQSIDNDLNNILKPTVKSQAQALKNKIQGGKKTVPEQQIPPLGKQKQASEKMDFNTRNNDFQKKNNNGDNYINLSQNLVFTERDYLQHQKYNGFNQQPHSHRSHNIQGGCGESFRDRSYFDESPAIFDQHENVYPEDKRGSLSSQQVENSVQSQMQSMQAYRTDEAGESIGKKFDASTNLIQMHSIPQSSVQSSSRESKSKQQRSKGSKKESIHPSAEQSLQELSEVKPSTPKKPFNLMIRSNSECQIRDKEFYELCVEEEEDNEPPSNIFEAFNNRKLAQSNSKLGGGTTNQISESPAPTFIHNLNFLNANKSSGSSNNQMVFLSQQTYNKMQTKYQRIDTVPLDQNSSQQQTRGKGTFKKFMYDPLRLLASIRQGNTHLLMTSLDDGTLNMQQYKKTLLMMANLQNNCLHSQNTGTLFTGWNELGAPIGLSCNNLTNIGRLHKEFINQYGSTRGASADINAASLQPDQNLKSLGGEPVNISHLLMGIKQQPTDPINVGSITIVDDDGKFMVDGKLLLEANNSSQQTKGRKLFSNSRNMNGQVTATSDFSNLQTKQLGIQRYQILNNKNRKPSDSVNTSQVTNAAQQEISDTNTTPNQLSGCYGIPQESAPKLRSTESKKPKQLEKQVFSEVVNQNKIMNLLVGLKSIQQKNSGSAQQQQSTNRSGSDLSMKKSVAVNNFKTLVAGQEIQSQPTFKQILKFQQKMNSESIQKSKSVPKKIGCNVKKEKVKLVMMNDIQKAKLAQNNEQIVKNFNTIIGVVAPKPQLQLCSSTKRPAKNNARTNSSCIQNSKINNFMLKKGSFNSAGVSSARNSNGSIAYAGENQKPTLKKKVNLKQFQSQQMMQLN